MANSTVEDEALKTNRRRDKKPKKKKSLLGRLLKLLVLVLILLLLLWQFIGGGRGLGLVGGGSIPTFGPSTEESTPRANEKEEQSEEEILASEESELVQITISEDKIYLGDTLMSLEDLARYLSENGVDQKIVLKDDKAINRVFNEVITLLENNELGYMIE